MGVQIEKKKGIDYCKIKGYSIIKINEKIF